MNILRIFEVVEGFLSKLEISNVELALTFIILIGFILFQFAILTNYHKTMYVD